MSKLGCLVLIFGAALLSMPVAARAQGALDPPPFPMPPSNNTGPGTLAPQFQPAPIQVPTPTSPSGTPPAPFQPGSAPQPINPAAPASQAFVQSPQPTGPAQQPIRPAQQPFAYGQQPAASVQQPYTNPIPVTAVPPSGATLSLTPGRIVMAVGSEITMVANMFTATGQPVANQRIEWHLAPPPGVGQFVVGMPLRAPLLNNTTPRLTDARTAAGNTLAQEIRLTRGTNNPADDQPITPGKAWIGVTSATEGESQITIVAPGLAGPNGPATQTAQISWVDVQWVVPPSASAPVGTPQTLTTTIRRKTNNAPIAGWRVRYEIVAGTDSGLGPQAAKAADVTADDQGRATVELKSPPAAGVIDVRVQVIRPARKEVPGDQDLLVGFNGLSRFTWYQPNTVAAPVPAIPSSPPPAAPITPAQPLPLTSAGLNVRVSGPNQSTVGQVASYRIDVSNDGDKPADGATLSFQFPSGAALVESRPQARGVSGGVSWDVGSLAARDSRTFNVDLRFDRPGTVKNQATVRAADGRVNVHSVSTIVKGSPLELRVTAPQVAAMGDDVRFEIDVTNRADQPTGPLQLVDTFDDGFDHVMGSPPTASKNPATLQLDSISPGQTTHRALTLKAVHIGTLCNTVEITGDSGLKKSLKVCLQVRDAGSGSGPSAIVLQKTGLQRVHVGDQPEYLIEITNRSGQTIPKLTLSDQYDARLPPVKATDGYSTVGNALQWTIEDLKPNETQRRQIVCQAKAAGKGICSRVIATIPGLPAKEINFCVQVDDTTAAPLGTGQPDVATASLSLKITDRDDPIRVGGTTSYLITLLGGAKSVRDVGLTVNVPAGMAILDASGPVQKTIDGQSVQFSPVAEIHPGESLSFDVKVRADRVGVLHTRATATSKDLPGPLTGDESTTILAP